MKPRLHSHLTLRVEAPGPDGEELLVIESARRRIALKGRSFREFAEVVAPLLDGRRTLDEIQQIVAGTFAAQDVAACIRLLADQNVVEDAEEPFGPDRRAPQAAFFRELGLDPQSAQRRLGNATVAVVGLGSVGAAAALALAAAGAGRLRLIDPFPVAATDPFVAPCLSLADVGRPRAQALADRVAALVPDVAVEVTGELLRTDEEVAAAVAGASVALCCLNPGLASLSYRLNRACLAARVPCCYADADAFEGRIGPTVIPFEGPCYLCYQMRLVACAEDPEDAFASLRHLDRSGTDDSGRRENLPFCGGTVGNLAALEAFTLLVGGRPPTSGAVSVIDFVRGATGRHIVLRKPWCPACCPSDAGRVAALV